MLSVQSSHSTAIFAFDPHDEVVIQGTAYRPLERRPEGYIFQRTDASGLAEVSIGIESGPHIGTQKGPLRRIGS